MYHFIYKTTNTINNKIYVGKHSTENIDDGYLGSGKILKDAISKYGKENFTREIVEYFDSPEDVFLKEHEIVNLDFINRCDTYNLKCGGDGGFNGKVVAKDINGETYHVDINDPRYLSGDLVGIVKGYVTVKDCDGNTFQTTIDDPNYINGSLVHHTKNTITVKDSNGNTFRVSTHDKRYLSGELVGVTKNNKASTETKKKMSNTRKGRTHSKTHKDNIRKALIGKTGNTIGRVWMNNKTNKRKLIKKSDIPYWVSIGWIMGFKYE